MVVVEFPDEIGVGDEDFGADEDLGDDDFEERVLFEFLEVEPGGGAVAEGGVVAGLEQGGEGFVDDGHFVEADLETEFEVGDQGGEEEGVEDVEEGEEQEGKEEGLGGQRNHIGAGKV